MNRRKIILPVAVIGGLLLLAATVVFAINILSDRYLTAKDVSAKPGVVQCSGTHAVHTVVIEDNVMVPAHTDAALCDSLTVINKDNVQRNVAFGQHTHHTAYDGVAEKLLGQNGTLTIQLDQLGTYTFHDHFHDEVAGTFTVSG